ncbi:MAG: histidine kinase [Bacteroidetes bacterium]|nr:histidine kinase [Bacteroidota bacterium]
MRKRDIFFIVILFFAGLNLPAQNPFVQLYTTSDGLPSNSINCIEQDGEKFIWFATRGGLVRYDGSSFTNYSMRDGLNQNHVIYVKVDSFGRVWFFCIGSTMNFFYQNKIYNSTNAPFLKKLRGNWNFVQDKERNLYFYNYHGRKIIVLDTNNNVTQFELPSVPLESDSITTDGMNIQYLARIPSGEFMIWTYMGIFKTKDLAEKPIPLAYFERYHNIYPLGDTVMYDVIAYPEAQTSVLIKYLNGVPVDTTNFMETALDKEGMILEDTDGKLWISSPVKGLYCLKNKQIIYHFDVKEITWIRKDHEGNIWINSKNGAYKISPYLLYYKHFDNSYFQDEGVDALCTDPEGGIWGIYSNKVFLYRNNEFYSYNFSYLNYIFNQIDALENNTLIIGSYDRNRFVLTGVSTDPSTKSLKFGKIFKLPSEGNMTINKFKDEVCIHDEYSQTVTIYSVKNNFREINNVPVGDSWQVFYDARNNLVIVGSNGHFILKDKSKLPYDEFRHITRSLLINHKILDSSADVFLTMYDSLYLVNQKRAFNLTSSFDYSFNTPIKHITYNDQALYLSTFRNIYKCDNPLDIQDDKAVQLSLIDINFSNIRDILAYNDTLYIASGDGLTLIPTDLTDDIRSRVPVPYFRSILINDKEAGIYSQGSTIKGKNKFNFSFGSINYSQNPVLYSYMLEGYEDEWNIGTMNNVVFTNLQKGHYKFRLRAAKSNSPWSDPIEYHITVKATIWQHPLFYLVLSLLTAGLVSLLVIRRKNIQIKRQEIDHQLIVLEQKALQSMMNPHFIFNTLGSIQNYLLQNKPGEAGLYLSQFARLIRLNISSINSALINLEEEVNRLRIYLDLEKFRMENKFEYLIEIDHGIEEDEVYIPSMLIQPFVENSVWHGISALEEKGLIRISFSMHSAKALKIIVEDNGIGIKQSERYSSKNESHLHLSMEMIRKRIEIIGKKMKVETSMDISETTPGSPNPGTRVVLVVPFTYGDKEG